MLKFVGDICLTDGYFDVGYGVGSKLKYGFDPFQHIQRNNDDIWIGNFEGVAADTTNKTGLASHWFRVEPEYLNHIHHFDVYGLANNHAMQHGEAAYRETVETLSSFGSKVCMGGAILDCHGKEISVTALSVRVDSFNDNPVYWHNPEYSEIKDEIGKLPSDAYKILFVHWGNEFINYPSSQQKKFAHWLIDAGFDLIIGMHPHILQGYEVYKGKYIFYSLGNFVFDMAWEPTHYGAIVNVDFVGAEPKISYNYVKIGSDYSPRIIDEAEVPSQYCFKELNKLIAIEENSEEYHNTINKYYRQYRRANHRDILIKMFQHPSAAIGIIKDFINRRF